MYPLLLLLLVHWGTALPVDHANERLISYLRVNESHIEGALTRLQRFYGQNRVHIYCRRDEPLELRNIFQSNRLRLLMMQPNAEFKQYRAATAQGVYRAHEQGRECHEGKLLAAATKRMHYISLPAHAHACYGIYTQQAFNLTLLQLQLDEERVAQFVLGLVLWFAAPLCGQYLMCCYCVAVVLGVHLASLVVVFMAVLCAGELRLNSLRPMGGNLKLVLERQPSLVALTLVAGALLLLRLCERHCRLWRHERVRRAHCRLLRFFSYALIYGASDHARFGYFCIAMLLPWPELWWLLRWLRLQGKWLQRRVLPPQTRRLLSAVEFHNQVGYETQCALLDLRQRLRNEPPSWEQMAQMQQPREFAQFLNGANHVPQSEPPAPAPAEATHYSSSTLSSSSSSLLEDSTPSADLIFRNFNYMDSARSLRRRPTPSPPSSRN
ncbi:uncharacterized protein LOC108607941 [Drosophila busckii]|uniref:uncharacterized protein LOC108607941 n=1 Tax=Drosophila busckii TaxID=30019 RepID=UPI00083ED693|nr:uncharacterized protein LOC108607941 [Drosophila busckii]